MKIVYIKKKDITKGKNYTLLIDPVEYYLLEDYIDLTEQEFLNKDYIFCINNNNSKLYGIKVECYDIEDDFNTIIARADTEKGYKYIYLHAADYGLSWWLRENL